MLFNSAHTEAQWTQQEDETVLCPGESNISLMISNISLMVSNISWWFQISLDGFKYLFDGFKFIVMTLILNPTLIWNSWPPKSTEFDPSCDYGIITFLKWPRCKRPTCVSRCWRYHESTTLRSTRRTDRWHPTKWLNELKWATSAFNHVLISNFPDPKGS